MSVYCLLELKCQVVRAEIGFKMCRFPSVGSVDLRLAPLITFACGCHRSEKAASVHPTRKNAKSRLVELKSPMVQPFGRSKTITLELVHSVLKIIKISLKMLFNLRLFQPMQCISWSLNNQLIDLMIDFRCQ